MCTKLTIELIPKTSMYSNVRSVFKPEEWDILRKDTYNSAHNKCELCGGQGDKWPVECHEVWSFDKAKKLQLLEGLIALCPDCHKVKHFGRTSQTGQGEQAFLHIKKVNGWNDSIARKHVMKAFKVWEKRNDIQWKVDITWALTKLDNLRKPVSSTNTVSISDIFG